MSDTTSAVADAPAIKTTPPAGAQDASTATATAAATTPAAETAGQPATTTDKGTVATPPGPPEKYELTVADEGVITAEGLKAFEDEVRALGLSNEAAQAYLDRRIDGFFATVEADRKALEAHPVYGGANLPIVQKHANQALDRFAPVGTPHGDGIRALLRESGRGDAWPIVAFLSEIGKAAQEDRPPTGGDGTPAAPPVRLADAMYAGSTSKQ
jgi:hypothetical protein